MYEFIKCCFNNGALTDSQLYTRISELQGSFFKSVSMVMYSAAGYFIGAGLVDLGLGITLIGGTVELLGKFLL